MSRPSSTSDVPVRELPETVIRDLARTPDGNGNALHLDDDSDGRTLFDSSQSEDGTVIAVFPQEKFNQWRTQALAHIHSKDDDRTYLAQVIRGPFAEPNGLPSNSPLLRATQVERTMFTPPYHGWVGMSILGEVKDGSTIVPMYRPRPNSSVRLLTIDETIAALRCAGDINLGTAVGFDGLDVGLVSTNKHHIPRHSLVVGTTGAGKSTFIASYIEALANAGFCVIVIDVEPEYAEIHKPAESKNIVSALKERGLQPAGIPNNYLLVPTNCEAACPDHPHLRRFSLEFANLSPYLAIDLLQANDAQSDRFLAAYESAGDLLTQLMPADQKSQHSDALRNWDDQVSGYPDLKLGHVLDMAEALSAIFGGAEEIEQKWLHDDGFKKHHSRLNSFAQQLTKGKHRGLKHVASWKKTVGLLGTLYRTKLFDLAGEKAADGKSISNLDYYRMLEPGRVMVLDMHDVDSPQHRNLAISELLRGVMEAQDKRYMEAPANEKPKTVIIIEEAHEFVSGRRYQQMAALRDQINRIARRGRKRWLGLTFATQFPQHLPDELFTLCNNRILMKLADEPTIRRMKNSIGGVPENLWARLKNLPTGQAIVSAQGIDPAMLVSLKPGRCKLLMVD